MQYPKCVTMHEKCTKTICVCVRARVRSFQAPLFIGRPAERKRMHYCASRQPKLSYILQSGKKVSLYLIMKICTFWFE